MGCQHELTRRELIARAGFITAGAALAWPRVAGSAETRPQLKNASKERADDKEAISPVEDLMREHGVLNRMLLIYEHQQKRLADGADFSKWAIAQVAGLISKFIEEYHERLEETYIFTRFERGPMLQLSQTLLRQHAVGRRLTESILTALVGDITAPVRARMAGQIGDFIRMYRPHEAWEDTVLFPAVRSVVSKNEYDEMGRIFEQREHELFGENGFKDIVEHVAQIERQLGLYDLEQFTPKI